MASSLARIVQSIAMVSIVVARREEVASDPE